MNNNESDKNITLKDGVNYTEIALIIRVIVSSVVLFWSLTFISLYTLGVIKKPINNDIFSNFFNLSFGILTGLNMGGKIKK